MIYIHDRFCNTQFKCYSSLEEEDISEKDNNYRILQEVSGFLQCV